MNNKLLVVFSFQYPYNPPTEQFLNDEMSYLVKEDVDILLVPIARKSGEDKYTLTDGLNNVNVIGLRRYSKIKESVIGTGFALGHILEILNDFVRITKLVPNSFRGLAFKQTIKQYIQGGALLDEIIKQIKLCIKPQYSEMILYSYWLSPTALAMSIAKEKFKKKYALNIKAYCRAHGDGDLYHKGLDKYRPCSRILNEQIDCFFPISYGGYKQLMVEGFTRIETRRLGVYKQESYLCGVNNVPLIVSCSVVNSNKRVWRIAEILSYISTPLKWIHFGGGPKIDELTKYCSEHLPKNIDWTIKGWTQHEEVMSYYGENVPDLFINVSEVEGIPVSIMEAFSYSIPCIATNVGATNEIVVNGENGFLISPIFDSEDVARIIMQFLYGDSNQKERMRRNAYSQFLNNYNAESNYFSFAKRLVADR